MDDGFYDARTARRIAFGQGSTNITILQEIDTIREAVATAAGDGDLTVTISDSTTMTNYDNYNGSNTSSFFDAFAGLNLASDGVKKSRDAMNLVINYFVRLGYTITRCRNAELNKMNWVLRW